MTRTHLYDDQQFALLQELHDLKYVRDAAMRKIREENNRRYAAAMEPIDAQIAELKERALNTANADGVKIQKADINRAHRTTWVVTR